MAGVALPDHLPPLLGQLVSEGLLHHLVNEPCGVLIHQVSGHRLIAYGLDIPSRVKYDRQPAMSVAAGCHEPIQPSELHSLTLPVRAGTDSNAPVFSACFVYSHTYGRNGKTPVIDPLLRHGLQHLWHHATKSQNPSPSSRFGSTHSGGVFDLANDEREIEDLERRSAAPEYWDDPDTAQKEMRRLGELKSRVEDWQKAETTTADMLDLLEMAADDPDMIAEIDAERDTLVETVDRLELQAALDGPYDREDALLVIHSGEGGVDAQDWAEMLSRMYLRWGDKHGFKTELLDATEGEEAGIKNATIDIRGPNAYGMLKGEGGGHRLVRLSPFDSAHRRHTAFALVEILPQIQNDHEINLNPDDVRVDTYRASGAGGQHVNKTSSAVRLTHLPTGIVVTCQNERSQIQNRESAFKILRSRLLEKKIEEEEAEKRELKGDVKAAGFGSRIRSYVLHPYTQVTDHRTDVSVGDANAVINGELDPFIEGWLQHLITPAEVNQ